MFRGSVIAQIIAVIGAIFLAKIYGEEAYGIFGVFMSILSIISIVATLQLDKCIVIAKNKRESNNWFNFLILLTPFLTIGISLIVFLISKYFFLDKIGITIIILSSIGCIIYTYNLINESLFTFKKEFSIISNTKVFLTISNIIMQYLLYYYFSLLGLIIGFIISQLIILSFYLSKNRNEILKINFKEIKRGITENNTIVQYLLPSSSLNSLANNLMPILILTFFGPKEAGVYFFSIKILSSPLSLISSSISKVFFQRSSELLLDNKQKLFNLTKNIVITNLGIMIILLIIINTIGMHILELYFLEKWNNLRLYTLILSILIFARTSFNPISSLIVVLNKNLQGLIFNSYLFLINLMAIYFGFLYNNITITILILAIFGGIGYVFLLFYFLNHLKKLSKNNV